MLEADNNAVKEESVVKEEHPNLLVLLAVDNNFGVEGGNVAKAEYYSPFTNCAYDLVNPCGVNDEYPEADRVDNFIGWSRISDPDSWSCPVLAANLHFVQPTLHSHLLYYSDDYLSINKFEYMNNEVTLLFGVTIFVNGWLNQTFTVKSTMNISEAYMFSLSRPTI